MSQRIKEVIIKRGAHTGVKEFLSDIGKSFSQSADKAADILLESSQKTESTKGRRLKEETFSMIRDITSQIRRSLKGVKPKDLLNNATYGMGRFSRMAKDTYREFFNDFIKKQKEKEYGREKKKLY